MQYSSNSMADSPSHLTRITLPPPNAVLILQPPYASLLLPPFCSAHVATTFYSAPTQASPLQSWRLHLPKRQPNTFILPGHIKYNTTRSQLSSKSGENTLFSSLFLLFYFVRNLPHILSEERNYGHFLCQTNIYYYIEKFKMYADSKILTLQYTSLIYCKAMVTGRKVQPEPNNSYH